MVGKLFSCYRDSLFWPYCMNVALVLFIKYDFCHIAELLYPGCKIISAFCRWQIPSKDEIIN